MAMWQVECEQLGDRQIKYRFFEKSNGLPFNVVLKLWQEDAKFRDLFIQTLVDIPFEAFRWETPPLTKTTGDRPFEFVVSDSPGLSRRPDTKTFQTYLEQALPDEVAEFANLGGDAWLIVPRQIDAPEKYVHLAVFMREAPTIQKHNLLKHMGIAVEQHLGAKPIWLSTAGGGIAWLHVRLDSSPKYYRYHPYKVWGKI